MMKATIVKTLTASIIRILRPLVRLLLRNGMSFVTFSNIVKWVYVDVATREFGLDGRKQSISTRLCYHPAFPGKKSRKSEKCHRPLTLFLQNNTIGLPGLSLHGAGKRNLPTHREIH